MANMQYIENMPKMIQIRHVPDAVHRKLKARAANLALVPFGLFDAGDQRTGQLADYG